MKGFSGFFQFGLRHSLLAKVIGWKNVCAYWIDSSIINCSKFHSTPIIQHLSSSINLAVSWECSSYEPLLRKLQLALDECSADESFEAFNNYKSLHGFPKHELVNKLINSLSSSYDRHWLRKAYDLALVILDEKPNLLYHDSLTSLALALARAQMPAPASTVLRIILERFKLPSIDTWNILFSHLVKTQIGSYFASEILVEICEHCLCRKSDGKGPKHVKLMTPSTIMFNLVLNSCLQFRSMLKAQQIIELMPQAGVVADANTIVIIARIYERVGQRDELKKLQEHIDAVSSVMLNRQYQQFYDSLLSLHFKFNDLDAAAELILDLYRLPKLRQPPGGESCGRSNGLQKHCLFQIGSSNLRTGSKILVNPVKLQKDLVLDTQSDSGFVLFVDGKLVPSNKAFAKLINGFVKEREVNKLSNLLIKIQKELDSKEAILCTDVMDACIQIGWLEAAHDILDDLESAELPVRASTYETLLRAYCKEKMFDESKLLLKQMRKADHFVHLSDENATLLEDVVSCLDERAAASDRNSDLVAFLDREAREEGVSSSMVYEFNTSILFFCKAKMMDDALKTFKRMQERDAQPTVQTFNYLVNAYSSLNMYREITILWGEIRRLENGTLSEDRDLLDVFLCNFIRGGYFERVMEIVNCMVKNSMHIDKWKYRREFLKLHKDLYRSLKASDASTDAQSKRIEHVRAFKRWAGIDQKNRRIT